MTETSILISINVPHRNLTWRNLIMTTQPLKITTPVGRLIAGSIYEPRTVDFDGKPLVVKTGANAGKPRVEFGFGLAIPKNPGETHWSLHPFFAPVWAYGHQQFPAGEATRRDFAWKIDDGDSTELNKRNKRNCDREGFPGNWIIWFSGGMAPQVFNADGTQQILERDAIKRGYYVQVFGNVSDNKPSQSPGIYVNHRFVSLAGYGPEIQGGPDVSEAGFGQGVALPPGASMTPPAGTFNPAPLPPPLPPAASGVAIAPPPPPPAPPVAPPPAPAAPGRQMTAKANGATYEALIAGGWTDAMLIQHGMMSPPVAAVPLVPGGSALPPAPPAPTVVAPPPLPVIPNPAILAVPVAPPAPARQMTTKANGATYEVLIAGGWNDAMLVQHGMMVA